MSGRLSLNTDPPLVGNAGLPQSHAAEDRVSWMCGNVVGDRILGIGTGTGLACIQLARAGKRVIDLDDSAQAIDHARTLAAAEPDAVRAALRLLRGSLLTHDFAGETFQTILIGDVLGALEDPAPFVAALATRLEAAGRVVVTVPSDPSHSEQGGALIVPPALRWLATAFDIVEVKFTGHWIGLVGVKRAGPRNGPDSLLTATAMTRPNPSLELQRRDQRIAALEQQLRYTAARLQQLQESTSFALGRALVRAAISIRGALAFPAEMLGLLQRGVRRRRQRRLGSVMPVRPASALAEVPAVPAPTPVLPAPVGPAVVPAAAPAVPSTLPYSGLKRPSEFRVAIIADEFTTQSFRGEFQHVPVEPNNWQQQFEEHRPDLFFCESAWSGPDSTVRPWKGRIYASERFPRENRTALLEILAHCRKSGIPTIFWNKEDPAYFGDKVHNFTATAKLFDFVFTTADECVEGYRRDHDCKSVATLPFATQPRLFNPLEIAPRSNEVVFAGSWYSYHEDRSRDMVRMFDRLVADGFALKIYDRYFGDGDANHHYPEKYRSFVRPGVPHANMDAVYKESVFGLNFNTITQSRTMFARRVFELMSSNTLVLSNYSRGMHEMFGESVVFLDRDPDRLASLTVAEVDAMRETALDKVLRDHTYQVRWRQVLTDCGIAHLPADESTTLVWKTSCEQDALQAIQFFERERTATPDLKLLLLLTAEIAEIDVSLYYQRFNRLGVTVASMAYGKRYGSEQYRPIGTRNFVLVDPDGPPAPGWAGRAARHLVYSEARLIGEAVSETKYRVAPQRRGQALIGRAGLFAEALHLADGTGIYQV